MRIDKLVYGDNQFFGINHRSQDKAKQQADRFRTLDSITEMYEAAISCGIKGIMLNSNDRAGPICDWFRERHRDYGDLNWYPSIPYPHKYANLVTQKGVVAALAEVLVKRNTAVGLVNLMFKGMSALVGNRETRIMELLVDLEMRPFRGLNVRAIFLQNVVVDLLLGLGMHDVIASYCSYVTKRYAVLPGLITQNLPRLVSELKATGVEGVVICTSFNKIGYLMSPDKGSYIRCLEDNDPEKYQIMAMSPLASGAIEPREAFEFLNEQPIQSIVFGASSAEHIRSTISAAQRCASSIETSHQ